MADSQVRVYKSRTRPFPTPPPLPLHRLKCTRCVNGNQFRPPPDDATCNGDLSQWHHASGGAGRRRVPDPLLRAAWDAGVQFVFHQRSHEQLVTP